MHISPISSTFKNSPPNFRKIYKCPHFREIDIFGRIFVLFLPPILTIHVLDAPGGRYRSHQPAKEPGTNLPDFVMIISVPNWWNRSQSSFVSSRQTTVASSAELTPGGGFATGSALPCGWGKCGAPEEGFDVLGSETTTQERAVHSPDSRLRSW